MENDADQREEAVVRPIPETDEALDEYLEEDGSDLRAHLSAMAATAVGVVPSCVGLSLGLATEGLTFTFVASAEEMALIDVAWLPGGSDVDTSDLLDEGRWSAFARASAVEGVQSSLSLPVMNGAVMVGGLSLYAAQPSAFADKEDALAQALGASAEGAVSDADLGFSTRLLAQRAPTALAEARTVDLAVGMMAAQHGVDVATALARLEDAARQSDVRLPQAAEVVNRLSAW